MHGPSPVAASGGHSSLQCTGFSLWWPLTAEHVWALGTWASAVVACGLSSCGSRAPEHRLSSCGTRAPEHRLSSCGARAQLLRGMWDPPGPGLEPVSPALAGGLPTTVPPGKPLSLLLNVINECVSRIKCLYAFKKKIFIIYPRL